MRADDAAPVRLHAVGGFITNDIATGSACNILRVVVELREPELIIDAADPGHRRRVAARDRPA